MTQATSEQRVKHDSIGDSGMQQLFAMYSVLGVNEYRNYCIDVINKSTGKKETRLKFISQLQKLTNSDKMLKLVTNYLLAGQGLGV